jgi:hypothetical protein
VADPGVEEGDAFGGRRFAAAKPDDTVVFVVSGLVFVLDRLVVVVTGRI